MTLLRYNKQRNRTQLNEQTWWYLIFCFHWTHFPERFACRSWRVLFSGVYSHAIFVILHISPQSKPTKAIRVTTWTAWDGEKSHEIALSCASLIYSFRPHNLLSENRRWLNTIEVHIIFRENLLKDNKSFSHPNSKPTISLLYFLRIFGVS